VPPREKYPHGGFSVLRACRLDDIVLHKDHHTMNAITKREERDAEYSYT